MSGTNMTNSSVHSLDGVIGRKNIFSVTSDLPWLTTKDNLQTCVKTAERLRVELDKAIILDRLFSNRNNSLSDYHKNEVSKIRLKCQSVEKLMVELMRDESVFMKVVGTGSNIGLKINEEIFEEFHVVRDYNKITDMVDRANCFIEDLDRYHDLSSSYRLKGELYESDTCNPFVESPMGLMIDEGEFYVTSSMYSKLSVLGLQVNSTLECENAYSNLNEFLKIDFNCFGFKVVDYVNNKYNIKITIKVKSDFFTYSACKRNVNFENVNESLCSLLQMLVHYKDADEKGRQRGVIHKLYKPTNLSFTIAHSLSIEKMFEKAFEGKKYRKVCLTHLGSIPVIFGLKPIEIKSLSDGATKLLVIYKTLSSVGKNYSNHLAKMFQLCHQYTLDLETAIYNLIVLIEFKVVMGKQLKGIGCKKQKLLISDFGQLSCKFKFIQIFKYCKLNLSPIAEEIMKDAELYCLEFSPVKLSDEGLKVYNKLFTSQEEAPSPSENCLNPDFLCLQEGETVLKANPNMIDFIEKMDELEGNGADGITDSVKKNIYSFNLETHGELKEKIIKLETNIENDKRSLEKKSRVARRLKDIEKNTATLEGVKKLVQIHETVVEFFETAEFDPENMFKDPAKKILTTKGEPQSKKENVNKSGDSCVDKGKTVEKNKSKNLEECIPVNEVINKTLNVPGTHNFFKRSLNYGVVSKIKGVKVDLNSKKVPDIKLTGNYRIKKAQYVIKKMFETMKFSMLAKSQDKNPGSSGIVRNQVRKRVWSCYRALNSTPNKQPVQNVSYKPKRGKVHFSEMIKNKRRHPLIERKREKCLPNYKSGKFGLAFTILLILSERLSAQKWLEKLNTPWCDVGEELRQLKQVEKYLQIEKIFWESC